MPIARVIDLETTGEAPPEAIIEVGWQDVCLRTLTFPDSNDTLIRPNRPIQPAASAVHHLIDEDVADAIEFSEIVPRIIGADYFVAHNAKFEQQWLTSEMIGVKPWICTYKCAMRLWPDAPGHGNQVLRYWRKPPGLDRKIASVSHRAFPDAYVTAFLFMEMIESTPIEQLIQWTAEPALLPRIKFGKHFGQKWSEPPSSYLEWILKTDFDEDVKFTAKTELARRRGQ